MPHFDLGIIIEDSLDVRSREFDQLLVGYGLDQASFEALSPDVRALRLLIRTDKIRWALDRRPDRLAARSRDLFRFIGRMPS